MDAVALLMLVRPYFIMVDEKPPFFLSPPSQEKGLRLQVSSLLFLLVYNRTINNIYMILFKFGPERFPMSQSTYVHEHSSFLDKVVCKDNLISNFIYDSIKLMHGLCKQNE